MTTDSTDGNPSSHGAAVPAPAPAEATGPGGIASPRDAMAQVLGLLETLRHEVAGIKADVAAMHRGGHPLTPKSPAGTAPDPEASAQRDLEVEVDTLRDELRRRIADTESLMRSVNSAAMHSAPLYSSDLAPRGSAFREGASDLRPRSPFGQ